MTEYSKMIRLDLGEEIKGHGIFVWRVPSHALEGRSRQPLLDACRAIKRMGGARDEQQIAMWRKGKDRPDAYCGIGWGAAHTVDERGPWFVKWRPYPGAEVFAVAESLP